MLGLLVVTHGAVAKELVAAVGKILGEIKNLEAVSIDWNDDVDEATRRIEQARKRVDGGRGVLLLTDMFGGTPTNLALSMLEPGRLEIVTGVNLPMLIKFSNLDQELSLRDAVLCHQLMDDGVVLEGGDDAAFVVFFSRDLMQERMRLDEGENVLEIAPKPDGDLGHHRAQFLGVWDDNAMIGSLEPGLKGVPGLEIEIDVTVLGQPVNNSAGLRPAVAHRQAQHPRFIFRVHPSRRRRQQRAGRAFSLD